MSWHLRKAANMPIVLLNNEIFGFSQSEASIRNRWHNPVIHLKHHIPQLKMREKMYTEFIENL